MSATNSKQTKTSQTKKGQIKAQSKTKSQTTTKQGQPVGQRKKAKQSKSAPLNKASKQSQSARQNKSTKRDQLTGQSKTSNHGQNNAPLKASPRWQAMDVVEKVLYDQAFSHDLVSQSLDQSNWEPADRHLFTELVYGTIQHALTLESLLAVYVKKVNRVKKWLRALLLISLYQHYYLDSIPDYALVDEAVRVAKKRGNPALGRFANGVLRNIFRQESSISAFLDQQQFVSAQEKLALTYSLPQVWVDYLSQRFGLDRTEQIAASLLEKAPITIRISPLAAERQLDIVNNLENHGLQLTPSPITPYAYQLSKGSPARSQAFLQGDITIQDASAQLAAWALGVQAGDKVLDACAAPGGKTVQLAEMVGPQGQVVAGDLQANKLPKIQANLDRMGVASQVTVNQHDASALEAKYDLESFDRILVDAPCSGLGLFRRKPDTKYHKSLQDLAALQNIQLEILNSAYKVLKKGGELVYSTCTITNEENTQVVMQFLADHPDMSIRPLSVADFSVSEQDDQNAEQVLSNQKDSSKPGMDNNQHKTTNGLETAITDQGSIEILPDAFASDGFFIARLHKES
ncbi:16S rRNA (cytosine(967)-C(5))-methyltransferase RsmB [Aerococcus kribbianus]|uniref:16S rRNA (cytosine(967)-C(5))-methyltransferase n=1 Tax=Aerococcus kribbianus TaxID=2999064 RepID=A0A9X3JF30_9LACT|nr:MULTISPECIES: 16S rRNA (cytosine(967)-C(5))-methyltransferase RsmB [unclassified Aerococcus]MCZ0717198.1 16S rRNA (cytosine(967)-C(5))-methyltransferase RsmB [Aerococcus sp. YH-aer221]MCZ0725486.1 16S rRNA (cytosine(967)-C(5))-methyltransferase RsmB [Aerococcus sp. YH-aer222]